MKRTAWTTMVFVGALTAATAAGAGVAEDLRCEALKLRREGRHYNCLSRCERRAERQAEQLGDEAAEGILQECVDGCDAALEEALERIETKRSVCSPDGDSTFPPDPNRCSSKLFNTEANFLTCKARCMKRSEQSESFDVDACEVRCTARNERQVERILGSPLCDGVTVSAP
jgi:hypothetical protein